MLKLAAFSLLPAISLLAVAEIVSSVTITRRVQIVPVTDSADGAVYSMSIGMWPWSRRSTTRLNSLGFPDAEFPDSAQKGSCTHVVFAGDSYFFGDGVDGDSSVVSIIRRRVEEQPGRCIRVFNISERGTTIDRQAARIRQTLPRLRPDVVILGQYQNDLADLTAPGAILGPSRQAERPPPRRIPVPMPSLNIHLVKLLTYHSVGFSIRHRIRRDALDRWSVLEDPRRKATADRLMQTYREQFAALASELAGQGIALGVVIIPSKLDLLAGRFPEERFFLDLARAHGVPALPMFPVFDERRDPYTFLMYDGHLNEHGNRLLADAIGDWLFGSDSVPFVPLRMRAASGQSALR